MAKLTAYRPLDMGSIDWSGLFAGGAGEAALGANLDLDGARYADVVHAGSGTSAYLGGNSFALAPNGTVTAGIINGVFVGQGTGAGFTPHWTIADASAQMTTFLAAARTSDRADDGDVLGSLLSGDDVITGSPGADVLRGYAGNDVFHSGAGDDVLIGDAGNDTFFAGAGADRMTGGAGDDVYYVEDRFDRVFENIEPGSSVDAGGYDTIYTMLTTNLSASPGVRFVDRLVLEGAANVNGTGNALSNSLTGNAGANTLRGLDGKDMLDGGAGNDFLNGGTGRDVLIGGPGRDTMIGGTGADRFVFAPGDFAGKTMATADRITDFKRPQSDMIDLSAFGPLTFIGTDAFHAIAGEIRYQTQGPGALVLGDTNGDGVADLTIRMDGVHVLQAGDFVL